ncbi:hypothetical protein [Microbacterium album]|nr:hypothetical protein [Microbacterium album]
MEPRPKASLALLCLAAVSIVLAGCATPTEPPSQPGGPASGGPLVTPGHPVTVMDTGDGAELCLGAIAMSYPPQCGGPRLEGWDWAEWDGHFEDVSGSRWGEFHVVGTFDPETEVFVPVEVTPGADYDWSAQGGDDARSPDFSTPCPAPEGGWRVADPSRTTMQTLSDALQTATGLPGYAGAWVDQAVDEPTESTEPPAGDDGTAGAGDGSLADEGAGSDPLRTILNVQVAEDVASAEAALRDVWGGMLCVSEAERTEAELQGILAAVTSASGGMLTGWTDARTGTVHVEVVYDDGSLQQQLDAEHGEGTVLVSPMLKPVG